MFNKQKYDMEEKLPMTCVTTSDAELITPKACISKTPEAEGGGYSAADEDMGVCRVSNADLRPRWDKQLEFILACIGYAVGLGNIWRFPFLCYESGGGAFLIPYFIMLILCGIPLMYMEIAIGQYTRRGPIGALAKICPLFKGAGLASVVISFIFTTYYNIVITWAMYYLFNTFKTIMPWADCQHDWNSVHCWDGQSNATSNQSDVIRPNNSISPSQDFYERRVLEKTSGIDEPGVLRWDLALILLLAWILVYFCLFKGVRSTGKVVYFTATFPYLVLLVLLVRGLTLPGSQAGIDFYIKPKWHLLKKPEVWVNAAAQNFNSIGIAFGGLITMSSYNRFSNKIFKDVLTVSTINAATSLLAGFVIFSILGHIAYKQGADSVENVVSQGPGLVFIIYPEAFIGLPVAQLFAFLFFFMLVCLGIDSQFASVEVVVTTIQDQFGYYVKKYLKRKEVLVAVVCAASFLCGLPNVMQGGIYFFNLIDYYTAVLSLMYLAFFEVVAVSWLYGARRLAHNIQEMTGHMPYKYFIVCWYVLSPLLILSIWIFSMVHYKPIEREDYTYPTWAQGLGWLLASLSVVCIPIGMIHTLFNAKGDTFIKRLKNSLRSTLSDGEQAARYSIYPQHPDLHEMVIGKVPGDDRT